MLSHQIQWALSLRAIPYPATRILHYCGEWMFSADNGRPLTVVSKHSCLYCESPISSDIIDQAGALTKMKETYPLLWVGSDTTSAPLWKWIQQLFSFSLRTNYYYYPIVSPPLLTGCYSAAWCLFSATSSQGLAVFAL